MFEKKIFGEIKIKINFYKRRKMHENDKKKKKIFLISNKRSVREIKKREM